EQVLEELGATPAAVIDTHMHADYLSGARAAAARWQVPYFVHADDARSPYDGAEGRFTHQSLTEGDTIAFGRATLVAAHVPGHTLGSTALVEIGRASCRERVQMAGGEAASIMKRG